MDNKIIRSVILFFIISYNVNQQNTLKETSTRNIYSNKVSKLCQHSLCYRFLVWWCKDGVTFSSLSQCRWDISVCSGRVNLFEHLATSHSDITTVETNLEIQYLTSETWFSLSSSACQRTNCSVIGVLMYKPPFNPVPCSFISKTLFVQSGHNILSVMSPHSLYIM